LLFARSPLTGFVFDEQEAILASPYLRQPSAWLDAFRVDFWGLPVARTIGSYRPLPNLLWWPLAPTLALGTPFFLQLLGPALHATAVFLLYVLLRRHGAAGQRAGGAEIGAALGAGLLLTAGVATEAVTTVVGQADVLVAIWTLLALLSLGLRPGFREGAVFGSCLLGLLSKETMLGSLPLLCVGAIVLPRHPGSRRTRAVGALGVTLAALLGVVGLVLVRRQFFLGEAMPQAPLLALPDDRVGMLLRAFEQPRLPIDPQNNPLALAPAGVRVPTALGVYAASLFSMLVPAELCADYSFPRYLPHGWGLSAAVGAAALVLPLGWALVRALRAANGSASPSPGSGALLTLGLAWIPSTYFPVSNLLVLLPTIRAERLLYVPVIGLCVLLAALWPRLSRIRFAGQVYALAIISSAVQARAHALHYESDVLFWRVAARGAPASAKAHLNLGVMVGARQDVEGRIQATRRSVELAPKWPLGHVYLGDALCRAGRAEEAILHYERGLTLAPDEQDLAALALQCLWDAGAFEKARPGLERAAAGDPRGWLGYLLGEVALHGAENHGVPKAYRPRGYNQP